MFDIVSFFHIVLPLTPYGVRVTNYFLFGKFGVIPMFLAVVLYRCFSVLASLFCGGAQEYRYFGWCGAVGV